MAPWQRIWRFGLAPLFSPAGLDALAEALRTDDPRLVQGASTEPMPIALFADCPVEGACAIAFPIWRTRGVDRVGALDREFRRLSSAANDLLDEPFAVIAFVNWFDGCSWSGSPPDRSCFTTMTASSGLSSFCAPDDARRTSEPRTPGSGSVPRGAEILSPRDPEQFPFGRGSEMLRAA
jgi:hypothetical protein